MAAVILQPKRRMVCRACDQEFVVEDHDGRPVHDCPKMGLLTIPLHPLPPAPAA